MFGRNHASYRHGRALPGPLTPRLQRHGRIRCAAEKWDGRHLPRLQLPLGQLCLAGLSRRRRHKPGSALGVVVVAVVAVVAVVVWWASVYAEQPGPRCPPSPTGVPQLSSSRTTHQYCHPSNNPPHLRRPRTSTPQATPLERILTALQHVFQAHCSGPPAGSSHCPLRRTPTPAIHPGPDRPDGRREGRRRAG